ncbi:MAG TPA: Ig-like domain-containing protein [Thermoanaerobaculia bacterium]
MYHAARYRLWLLILSVLVVAVPASANVTVSGNVQFSSLDGSAQDADGVANGIFTVNGDLTVQGTINCNDDAGSVNNSGCPMTFAVSGDVSMLPGSALLAENRRGGGSGGDITINAGGSVTLQGPSALLPGARISTSRIVNGSASSSRAGKVAINAGGAASFAAGSSILTADASGLPTSITVTAGGALAANGTIGGGPGSSVDISLKSTSTAEPSLSIGAQALIGSLGTEAGHVVLEGCGILIEGAVGVSASNTTGASVTVRSGTWIRVDGRDLAGLGSRRGSVRADAPSGSASTYSVNLFAREDIEVLGPAAGLLYAVSSNGNGTNGGSGTITVVSLGGGATVSGQAFDASNGGNNGQGGAISISARNDLSLATARFRAVGDLGGGNGLRKGGTINLRSYSGAVTWINGSGDVRPVGSGSNVSAANQGKINLTYCTTYSVAGTTFPSNGPIVGSFPVTQQTCSPAAPSLPAGHQPLPVCNQPPVANPDAYTVAEGGTLNVAAPGVLGNDSDPDGNPITATLVSGPANGTLTFNADGSFTYVHDGSETTSDSFTYKANDGSVDGNTTTVTIAVTPVNDTPVAANDSFTVAEGGTLNVAAPGVLANDTDPDSSITATLVTGPAHGSLTLNADGSFVYVHDGGETTSDSFTYTANDGSATSNVATVSITVTPVNDAPVAANDAYSVAEGGTLNIAAPGVLGNDTDPDSSITATLVSGPANGSLTLNANGSFTYTHNGSETTSDSFTYTANDGSATSNVATVSIAVTPVDDAPVAVNDAYATTEGGTLNIAAPGVLANDTDADSASLTAAQVSGPAHGTLTLNADGSFTYVHDGSETTTDSFTYTANDGSSNSNVATVTITISPVNDAPVAVADNYSVAEGGTLNIAAPGVLGNDTDAEGSGLTATLVTTTTNGTLTFNADGSFTYVHDGGETTTDSFSYKANDGSLDSNTVTVTIAVNAVNDAPVAVADAYSVNEGGTLNIAAPGVLGNDTDVDDASLTAVLVSNVAHGTLTLNADGSFTYVHDGSETTSDSFSYKANDGDADSNVVTVTITVSAVNDAPVAVADAYSTTEGGTLTIPAPGVLGNDTDAEGSTLSAILVGNVSNGTLTLNADGSFTYIHNGGEATTDSFTYKANDGSLDSNTVTVTITIDPVNDAPVANPDAYTVQSGDTLIVMAPGVLGNDTDVDGPSLSAILVSGPTKGTLTLNANGSFTYASNANSTGTDTFTYKANDGSADSNIVTVTITILTFPPNANNDAFLAIGNTELRVGTGGNTTPHASVNTSVLANDTDPDTAPANLSVTAYDASSFAGGSVSMNPNGTFNYLPPVGFTGTDSFHYTVSDSNGNSDTATVTITVSSLVWYVNNTTAGGDGRSVSPFNTLAAAQVASGNGDTIYVDRGDGTTNGQDSGIVLEPGQRLIGEGAALVVNTYTLAPAGLRPTIGSPSTGVTLASGNTVAGLNVNATGFGISGSSVNGGTISAVSVTAGTDALSLSNSTGTFTLTDVALSGVGGLNINGGTPSINASNLDVTTTTGKALFGNAGSLTITAGSTVATSNGGAVDLSNMSLNVTLASINAANGVDGVKLTTTTGTFAANGGTITTMSGRGVNASNATGLALANVAINNSGQQAVLFSNSLGVASSVSIQSSTFTGNAATAVQTANSGSGTMTVVINGSTFTNNASAAVAQTTLGPLNVTITNNITTGNSATAFGVTRNSAGTGVVNATITGNTVGTIGVPNSGAVCGGGCGGVSLQASGTNAFNALVANNAIREVDSIGIRALANQGSSAMNLTITNNQVTNPVAGALFGINVQSGSLAADTTAVCASITGNTVTGGWLTGISVRNTSAGSIFSLPGYAGATTDTAAVAAFLSTNNGGTTATATRKTTAPANGFTGGAACATPTP